MNKKDVSFSHVGGWFPFTTWEVNTIPNFISKVKCLKSSGAPWNPTLGQELGLPSRLHPALRVGSISSISQATDLELGGFTVCPRS